MSILTPIACYKNHRFPIEVISHAVWPYFRFSLSFRDAVPLRLWPYHAALPSPSVPAVHSYLSFEMQKQYQSWRDHESGISASGEQDVKPSTSFSCEGIHANKLTRSFSPCLPLVATAAERLCLSHRLLSRLLRRALRLRRFSQLLAD
jgi:hypothetical protein